ncbi:MAG: response regulator transcription factor [Planctomycetota bacterium]|jgi:two-component system response regulator TtrR
MTSIAKQHIFFVDDEPKVRKVVDRTLEQIGLTVSCFACAADCLEQLSSQKCDLLITDVKMPEMDGIELLSEAKRMIPLLSVIVITGYGDIPMVVRAMKAGASDFIEKPLSRRSLLLAVESVLKRNAWNAPLLGKLLTPTERIILRYVLDGKSNKDIASVRHRAVSTIEDHRHNIFKKIGVTNLGALFKWAAKMRLI